MSKIPRKGVKIRKKNLKENLHKKELCKYLHKYIYITSLYDDVLVNFDKIAKFVRWVLNHLVFISRYKVF